ncbi:MAG: hypothetical protein R3F43_27410, partial [bacterium]
MSEATARLAQAAPAAMDDRGCCVGFTLAEIRANRRLPPFLDGNINLDRLRGDFDVGELGAFLVVDGISNCAGSPDAREQILGCTNRGQLPAVVASGAMGVVWAHEFGHAQGLPGRFPLDPECLGNAPLPLMTERGCPRLEDRAHIVTQNECASFRSLRPLAEN